MRTPCGHHGLSLPQDLRTFRGKAAASDHCELMRLQELHRDRENSGKRVMGLKKNKPKPPLKRKGKVKGWRNETEFKIVRVFLQMVLRVRLSCSVQFCPQATPIYFPTYFSLKSDHVPFDCGIQRQGKSIRDVYKVVRNTRSNSEKSESKILKKCF